MSDQRVTSLHPVEVLITNVKLVTNVNNGGDYWAEKRIDPAESR
jgi:hypothetical protein